MTHDQEAGVTEFTFATHDFAHVSFMVGGLLIIQRGFLLQIIFERKEMERYIFVLLAEHVLEGEVTIESIKKLQSNGLK